MTENILVSTAWPYANGDLHIGQLAGAHYGLGAIPGRWLRALHLREEMEALALALYRMSMASPRE